MLPKPMIFVALDYRGENANNRIYETATRLAQIDGVFGFKLNIDAIGRYDPEGDLLKKVADLGRPVFADMKLGNGSSTMAVVTQDLCNRGAKIINAWAHLGPLLTNAAQVAERNNSIFLAMTVLTHFNNEAYKVLFDRDIDEDIIRYIRMAEKFGCHGVIIPGPKLHLMSGSALKKCVPAIRPEWYLDQDVDQAQPVTPQRAISGGADYLVCGRPITGSKDPTEALKRTLDELHF
jgi:orotidine-5'-phosphate decarboxylase